MNFNNNQSKYWDLKFYRFKNLYYPRVLIAQKDKRIIESIENLKNKKILKTDLFEEVHGNNNLIFSAAKKNFTVGIDISKKIAQHAKRYERGAFIVNSTISCLPFKDESFDVIISTSTIDHLPYNEVPNTFNELSRILKKDGIIFLTVDNYHNLLYRIEFIFWKFFNLYYRSKCFKISEIKHFANLSKLKVNKIETIMTFPPIIDKFLITLHHFFKIDTNEVFKFISGISTKLNKNHKYTSGRFIFVELTKR